MPEKRYIVEDKLVTAGLLGLSTIAVLTVLTMPQHDTSLEISLFSFAVAIPLLTGAYFIRVRESFYETRINKWYVDFIGVAGIFAGFIGIASIFFHFSIIIGILFIISAIFTFAVCGIQGEEIIKRNKIEKEKHNRGNS